MRNAEGQAFLIRAYVAREAGVSAAINGATGALFFFALFGALHVVPIMGFVGYAVDFIPQSAAVAFMACLVPSVLTRRAILRGRLPGDGFPSPTIARLIMIASLCAVLGAMLGGAIALLLRSSGLIALGHTAALIIKIIYGGLLGALTTWRILHLLFPSSFSQRIE